MKKNLLTLGLLAALLAACATAPKSTVALLNPRTWRTRFNATESRNGTRRTGAWK